MNEAGLQMIRKIREAEAAAQEGVQKDPLASEVPSYAARRMAERP